MLPNTLHEAKSSSARVTGVTSATSATSATGSKATWHTALRAVMATAVVATTLGLMPSVAVAAPDAAAAAADAKRPLLMPNKTTLYQRVLTTPDCLLEPMGKGAKAGAAGAGKQIPAFSQFYVYEDTGERYLVGTNATGDIVGYLNKSCVVSWKQQLAMLFTNPANRRRALIFEQEQDLDRVIDKDDGVEKYMEDYKQVEQRQQVPGVISIEPKEYVDYTKQFYLLPILQSNESIFPDGAYVYKHEIASITAKEARSAANVIDQTPVAADADADDDREIVGYNAAIVFVIDSSISMQRYIDRTKEAINAIYKQIDKNNLGDSVHFGIVSFRADTRKVPGLEYVSKIYLKPGEVQTAKGFNQKVAQLQQAKVSSAQFNEDSYAGINQALQEIDWQNYGGRYIVLITDAGAIDYDDEQSSTKLNAEGLRHEAQQQGVAIYTLHLLTPSGKSNHASARSQYQDLSFNNTINRSLYYSVDAAANSVNDFGRKMDVLTQSLVEQIDLAVRGEKAAGSAFSATDDKYASVSGSAGQKKGSGANANANANKGNNGSSGSKDGISNTDSLVQDSWALGHAMQLAYLGRVKGTKAPSFMKGWISDRDVVDHNQPVCQPVVLVNRNQLNDLYVLVKEVLSAGIAGQLSSDDMFSQLQAMAAQMGRDPNMLKESQKIGEMGIMNELLDDLPYKSRIASLSPEDWYNLGSQEQENIVRGLEASLNYLEQCAGNSDRFIKLNEKADSSEEVYPIPLDALP